MAGELVDGTFDFSLGQDSYLRPDRIQANQVWKGINVSMRGGVLSPRNGYHEQEITFDDVSLKSTYGHDVSIESIFKSGKYQARIPYTKDSVSFVVIVISGLIFKLDMSSMFVSLMSEDIKVDQYAPRINWSYAGDYIVLFDFPAYPVIILDQEVTRSDPENEISGVLEPQVPISCLGAYNSNRLFVAGNGASFTGGDPVGNLLTPEAPITFTEVFTPSSPFFSEQYTLPTEDAITPITAMGFLQQQDTSTGIGPLFIATEDKVFYYPVGTPRDTWLQQQFGSILLYNAGIVGQRAFVNVNSDLIFLSKDGYVHSITTARNDQQRWGNVPISREVQDFLRYQDPELAKFSVLGYFDNRVYITVNPYRTTALDRSQREVSDYAFQGLIVLELQTMSSLTRDSPPIWSGLWTGADVMDMFTMDDKFFIIAKYGGTNTIYEVMKDSTHDMVQGSIRPVESTVYFREFNFQNPAQYKLDHSFVAYVEDMQGDVSLSLSAKPSHAYNFYSQGKKSFKAPYNLCETSLEDCVLNGIAKQQVNAFVFGGDAEDFSNPVTGTSFRVYRKIQYKLKITGINWVIVSIKATATPFKYEEREEVIEDSCVDVNLLGEDCNDDWAIPVVSLCQE